MVPRTSGPTWRGRLERWWGLALSVSGAEWFVRRAWRRYFEALFDDLEGEDWQEALKRALPLGGGPDPDPRYAGAGAIPSARDFALTPRSRSGVPRISLGERLERQLQTTYEALAKRLEREGKVDEAAYVLAELLDRAAEAVALLERHERWALAAEVAVVKELAPEVRVRLLFLAGQIEAALAAASREPGQGTTDTGTLALAVRELERRAHPQAPALRLLWAATAARTGDFLTAVEAAGDLAPEAVRAWLSQGLALGGGVAARLAVWRLGRAPDALPEVVDALREVLEGDDPEPRAALMVALQRAPNTPSLQAVRRSTLRAVLGAAPRHGLPAGPLLMALKKSLGDVLVDDLPTGAPSSRPVLRTRQSAVSVTLGGSDRGEVPVVAAAWVGARLLLALGEHGAKLVGVDGRLHRQWSIPTHALVVDPRAGRALALTLRGSLVRPHQLDLATGGSSSWPEVRLSTWADVCSDLWFVVEDGRLTAIDTRTPQWRAAWSTEVEGGARALRATDGWLNVLTNDEIWRYELPRIVLRDRTPYTLPEPDPEVFLVGGLTDQGTLGLWEGRDGLYQPRVSRLGGWAPRQPEAPVRFATSCLGMVALGAGDEVVLATADDGTVRSQVVHEGASRVGGRLTATELVSWDELGRVVVLDLAHGDLRASVRTRR